MKETSRRIYILYIFLIFTTVVLMLNLWLDFISADNTAVIGVYSGAITASILCMNSMKGKKIVKIFEILACLCAILIVILIARRDMTWGKDVMTAIKCCGYVMTIGSILIKMRK